MVRMVMLLYNENLKGDAVVRGENGCREIIKIYNWSGGPSRIGAKPTIVHHSDGGGH